MKKSTEIDYKLTKCYKSRNIKSESKVISNYSFEDLG